MGPFRCSNAKAYAICWQEYSARNRLASPKRNTKRNLHKAKLALDMQKQFVRECSSFQDRKEIYGKNPHRGGSCAARAGFVSAQIRGFSMRIRSDPVCCASGQLSSGARYASQLSTRSRRGSLSLKNLAALLALVPFLFLSSLLRAEDENIYFKVSP